MNKFKSTKGITLISLVITIIILIILAGITINLSLGENGLFGRAKEARDKYLASAEDEQRALNELYKQLGIENLPENTKDTEAGTEVKPPEGWYSTTSAYVSTEDGNIVKKMTKVATVTAVATGNGETVPVPKGFYYVGGKISTGVVISDNPADQNKYVNYTSVEGGEVTEGIPSGAVYKEDGSAKRIEYDEKGNVTLDEFTAEEKKTAILGNQFVWIPVTASEYTKKTWGTNANGQNTWNATWEKQTHTSELPQIQKYGGFYVGRYEAGTSDITLSTKVDFASKNTASSWVNDNFSIRDGLNHTVESGKITTKAGEIPYYHADYETALKLSNNMYNTDYVQSGLVTGTMWDAMMKFIAKKADGTSDNTIVERGTWGNYTDGAVTYLSGKGRYASVNSSNGAINTTGDIGFVVSDGTYHYGIKTTAISEDVKKKNLYDVAGNLWEWTQEASYPNNTLESYMLRGGSFYDSYADAPACYRAYRTATSTYTSYGFRPALYIK